MMMELTFDTACGATRRSTVKTRLSERYPHAARALELGRPVDDAPEIGRGIAASHEWQPATRFQRRAESAFAAVVMISLLALCTLTFGYAFEGLATAHAASVAAVAQSE